MALIIQDNKWLLSQQADSSVYTKTLYTKDTYVDKDIDIRITIPQAVMVEGNQSLTVHPTINPVLVDDKYCVEINQELMLHNIVESSGWVQESKPIKLKVSGALTLNKTQLSTSLIQDSGTRSGYGAYRANATSGYNDSDLFVDTQVYQGKYETKE